MPRVKFIHLFIVLVLLFLGVPFLLERHVQIKRNEKAKEVARKSEIFLKYLDTPRKLDNQNQKKQERLKAILGQDQLPSINPYFNKRNKFIIKKMSNTRPNNLGRGIQEHANNLQRFYQKGVIRKDPPDNMLVGNDLQLKDQERRSNFKSLWQEQKRQRYENRVIINEQGTERANSLKDIKKLPDRPQRKKSPITDILKTEILLRQKEYLKTHRSDSSLYLGKEFNAESYLAPQRLREGQGDPMKRFRFNQVASDNTPFNRTLWDVRNPLCSTKYNSLSITNLSSTSVIICFHNEARSALLRTIYSVLSRSPAQLLAEIILVDDFSDDAKDGQLLTTVPKVKLIRLNQRHGLIRARIVGAKAAKGQILTFLDSHCEVITGWLEPLLFRIREGAHHVVSPVIDIIRKDNMQYSAANSNIKGGFGHNLNFKWDRLNVHELLDRRQDNTAPIKTPAIAGGLFAIDSGYFEHIGRYDEEMEIWGGENVEMSIRVWTCGGTLEIMPCSRVGHIFRSSMPYTFGPGKTYHTTVTRNLRRTAEVWMDDYKYLFYQANTHAKTIPYGDLTSRLELKRNLKCKSFSWFISNIYPEFISGPQKDDIKISGYLQQDGNGCLDYQIISSSQYKLTISKCKAGSELNNKKRWSFTSSGRIKHETLCLSVLNALGPQLHLSPCISDDKGPITSQIFEWTRANINIKIKHITTALCLAVDISNQIPTLQRCDSNSRALEWQIALY